MKTRPLKGLFFIAQGNSPWYKSPVMGGEKLEENVEEIEYARYILIKRKHELESLLLFSNVKLQKELNLEIKVIEGIDNYLLERLRKILY
mgnify:CR=1 FL=1